MALNKHFLSALGMTAMLIGSAANASSAQIQVDFRNNAPTGGTLQTPVWVGFHDGSFDTFTDGQAATAGLEALAEDGNTNVLSSEFNASTSGGGVDGRVGTGPIGPQGSASNIFTVNTDGSNNYFSYASMLLTSSDFFIGNGNPLAIDLADLLSGAVSSLSFDVFRVYDAGTEVNDFANAATAGLFGIPGGQTMPNQGDDENGVVSFMGAAGSEIPHSFDALNAYILFDNAAGISEDVFSKLNFSAYDSLGSFTLTNVSEVPVPAALFLFAPALMGLVGLRRKANKAG
tara:strand:- start:910 stop:1773 length:864 start_codon:yes stop_codon:yes gene_type:complete